MQVFFFASIFLPNGQVSFQNPALPAFLPALRLSKVLGRSPESWLTMQDAYDLWLARRHVDLQGVGKLRFAAAQHP